MFEADLVIDKKLSEEVYRLEECGCNGCHLLARDICEDWLGGVVPEWVHEVVGISKNNG